MKQIALILCILFTALAAKPCVDGENLAIHSRVEVSHASDGHNHTADLCSPFCSCACCGAQILNYQNQYSFELSTTLPPSREVVSHYKKSFVSGYFGSIWQPPQIS